MQPFDDETEESICRSRFSAGQMSLTGTGTDENWEREARRIKRGSSGTRERRGRREGDSRTERGGSHSVCGE